MTKRFEAYHWHVQYVADGNDLVAIEDAILAAKAETTRPSLIRVRTVIGYGSPKAGTNKVHGEALGAEAVKATKKNLGWPEDKTLLRPRRGARQLGHKPSLRGKKAHDEWTAEFEEYEKAYPEPAAEFDRVITAKLADGWEKKIPIFPTDKPVATRNAGQVVMNAIEKVVPELFGGAADLTASTKTIFKDSPSFHVDPDGPQRLLRRARVRHVRDGQRNGRPRRPDPVRLNLLRLLRLLPPGAASGRADERALALRLHARFGRPGRGRPDAPAHRAPDEPPR